MEVSWLPNHVHNDKIPPTRYRRKQRVQDTRKNICNKCCFRLAHVHCKEKATRIRQWLVHNAWLKPSLYIQYIVLTFRIFSWELPCRNVNWIFDGNEDEYSKMDQSVMKMCLDQVGGHCIQLAVTVFSILLNNLFSWLHSSLCPCRFVSFTFSICFQLSHQVVIDAKQGTTIEPQVYAKTRHQIIVLWMRGMY